MSWASFLFAYILGGLTFVPFILAVGALYVYLTLPVHDAVKTRSLSTTDADIDDDDIVLAGDDVSLLAAERKSRESAAAAAPRRTSDSDQASGYFAVCREYSPTGVNAKPIERSASSAAAAAGTGVAAGTVAAPSQSVYQTMYKSLFERKPASQKDGDSKAASSRPKNAGNLFYIVLRHGHLMLFDDEDQLEVRHVISLAHHDISIYSGDDGVTPEGELFIKRSAICLSRRPGSPDNAGPAEAHPAAKPFYLFAENCSAKEDFYFCLLRSQDHTFADGRTQMPPPPLQFAVKDIISLVQKLHSSEDHLQTRWLNAFLGRIFLGVYKTDDVQDYIRGLLMKKISRVKTPSFLTNIAIRAIDPGEGPPYITNPKLRELTVDGEYLAEADVKYTGNFRMEVAATARIDLGSRFKARSVDLMLSVTVKRIEGHMLFRVKPPPSNRLWFSFAHMPKMDMVVEPIVSSRQITYTVILRQIENRIKEVVAESLVQPFWDDVPFFKTEHRKWRGGVFDGNDPADEHPEQPEATGDAPLETISPMEKTQTAATSGMHKRKGSSVSAPAGMHDDAADSASSSSVDCRPTASTSAFTPAPVDFRQTTTSHTVSISPRASMENLAAVAAAPDLATTSAPDAPKTPARPSSSRKPSLASPDCATAPPDLPPRRPSLMASSPAHGPLASPPRSKTAPAPQPRSHSPARVDVDAVISSPPRVHAAAAASKMEPPVFPGEIELETEPTPYGGRRGTVSSIESDGNSAGATSASASAFKLSKAQTVSSIKSQANSFFSKTTAFIANTAAAHGAPGPHPAAHAHTPSAVSLGNGSATHASSGPANTTTGSPSRSRTESRFSLSSAPADMSADAASDVSGQSNGNKRNATLAAMTNAAVHARNWSIGALARRKESSSSSASSPAPSPGAAAAAPDTHGFDLSQPMGRGQPLPPIGTPLPPPEKGSKVTNLTPAMKRHSLAVMPAGSSFCATGGGSNGTPSYAASGIPTPATAAALGVNTAAARAQSPAPSRIPSPLTLRRTPSTASIGGSSSAPRSLSRASSRQSLRHPSPIQRRAFEEGSMLPTAAVATDPNLLVVEAPEDGSEPGDADEQQQQQQQQAGVSKRSYRHSVYGAFATAGSASSSSVGLAAKRSLSRLSMERRDSAFGAAGWVDGDDDGRESPQQQ